MLTRRKFLAATVPVAASIVLEPRLFAKRMAPPLGVQLYTVRQQVQSDLPGTLKAIRQIGYTTVETYAAQTKMNATDLRKAILDAGLQVPSGHFGWGDFDTKFDYAKELGLKYMVCSSVPEKVGNSVDGFKKAAEQYNAWGEKAHSMGMQFAFHNHNSEFQDFGGTTGFEVLMQNTHAKLVQWQMDCYWVAQAGQDPVAMLRKYAGRVTTLHLKDRKPGAQPSTELGPGAQHFTEVGNGTLDWKAILPLAAREGVRYEFVEQDITERPALESLKISYDNVQKILA